MQFDELKERILAKYSEALTAGVVDEAMIPINQTINSLNYCVTTSSCTGRITIISKATFRSKYETTFHFKTHDISEIDDLAELLIDNPPEFEGELWFLLEPPNLHIRIDTIEQAREIHQLALQSKLSKSKFQSIDPAIVVEILGTSSLQLPLGDDGEIMVEEDYINLVLAKAKRILKDEQSRLFTFHNKIEKLTGK